MVKTMGGEAAAGGSAPAEEPKVWELRYGPEVSAALGPLTMARSRTEAAWGRGTLPALVSPQTALKFAAAEAKLDAAIASMDAIAAAARADIVIRGLAALSAEAVALGHSPAPPDRVWFLTSDTGERWAVAVDDFSAHLAVGVPPERVLTAAELLRVWEADKLTARAAAEAKRAFPGAQVVGVLAVRPQTKTPPWDVSQGDVMPF